MLTACLMIVSLAQVPTPEAAGESLRSQPTRSLDARIDAKRPMPAAS